ncbi:MAG: hypothetical protein WC975_02175 [Phycisphaerae bacterium]
MKYMEKVYRQRRILDRPVKPDDDGGWVASKIGQTLLRASTVSCLNYPPDEITL